MHTNFKNLNDFFNEVLKDLPCRYDTKSYIISIFDKYKKNEYNLSKDSITILYASAKEKQDFAMFQNIGDWIFFCKTLYPQHLNNASEDYYRVIGRLSYNSCYRLIQRKWKLFEEMSDNFIILENEAKKLLKINLYR